MRRGPEEFTNFYTNRRPIAESLFNTDEQHGTTSVSVSTDEVTNNSSPTQENGELFRFEEDAVSTADTFTSAAEAIAQQLGVEIEIDESMPAKGSYNPHTQVAFASIPLAMLQPRMFSAQSCTKPSVTVAFRLYPANDSAKCANKSTT